MMSQNPLWRRPYKVVACTLGILLLSMAATRIYLVAMNIVLPTKLTKTVSASVGRDTDPEPDPDFQALVLSRYRDNPDMLRTIGARLVVGDNAPKSPVDGAMLITRAAYKGNAQAWANLSVLAAAGVGREQSWSDAFDALARAAEFGHPAAHEQWEVLNALGLRDARDAEAWIGAVEHRLLRERPHMTACATLVPPALCTHLMARAEPLLTPARVHDALQDRLKVDAMRTNSGAPFSLINTDLTMQLVRARIARAAGVAPGQLEPPEVLRYATGEQYSPHIDFFHPALPGSVRQIRDKGQRIKTCLVYLNEGYTSGETDFPRLGIKFRGRAGEALFFDNVDGNGAGNMDTLHAGTAPTRGVKWLLTQWIRDRPQPVA